MANAFTGGASGAAWDLVVETAYDRAVDYYLNDEPQWRNVIDKRPVAQAMPGDVVTLTLHNKVALATSALTETVDPDSVAMPTPTRVQVTLQEWGNAALGTLRLFKTGFTKPDRELAELIGMNRIDSIDAIIQSVADAGTNLVRVQAGALVTSGGADASIVATDVLSRKPAAALPKLLRRQKVVPKQDNKYAALIHPDVSFDIQNENSATAWVGPHTYGGDTSAIYTGTVGDFAGARYVETTRTKITATGPSSQNIYSTYFLGRQALVEAAVEEPHTVVGPQTDKLKRFFPIGWYALAGWAIYRPSALLTLKTQSTLGSLVVQ